MKMPRCGVPDIHKNGRSSMTSGKSNKKNHHDQNLLHTVSPYSLFPNMPRWSSSKTQLTYAFSSSSTPGVDIQTLRSVCSNAFLKWATVSGLSFMEAVADQADIEVGIYSRDHGDGFVEAVAVADQADVEIGIYSRDPGDGFSFDGPGGFLAHAFPPTDGRFDYDADENWSTNPRSEMSEMDLESVVVHEIGHLLGLDHNSVPTAVMASSIGVGVIKRELDGDDIAGIRALYGL